MLKTPLDINTIDTLAFNTEKVVNVLNNFKKSLHTFLLLVATYTAKLILRVPQYT